MLRYLVFWSVSLLAAAAPPATDPALLQQYSQQGERALAQGRYTEAESAYEKLRQLAPQTAEIYGTLGMIYFQQRKFAQAVPTLQQGLRLKPTLPNADVLLAMSLSELGRYSEALPSLRKGFPSAPNPALKRMAGLQLLRVYTGLQQDRGAVEVALELTRLYPDDPEILYHAGRLFGNYAYLTMQRLSSVAPDSAWKHQASGEVHESQGNYDLALAAYRRVLVAAPNRPGLHFRIGRTLLMRNRQPDAPPGLLEEAAHSFEQELQLDPTNANAAYELGEIDRRAGALDKAQAAFALALQHAPDLAEAHTGMARLQIATGHASEALVHLHRAVALQPLESGNYFHLAQAYRALGNGPEQQKALGEFRRLRDRQREREEVLNPLSANQVTRQEAEPAAQAP